MTMKLSTDILAYSQEGIAEWNRRRRNGENPESLLNAYLPGADMRHVDFSGLDLSGANLCGSDLERANLDDAILRGADLEQVNLHRATLRRADFTKAYMRNANLTEAKAQRAVFIESNLSDADLSWCLMDRARLIRADLSNANVNNASVLDVEISNLRGLPTPPEFLLLWGDDFNGGELIGDDAKRFFLSPSVLEVFVSEVLNERELASFLLHLAEMHDCSAGNTVYFVGHRHELNGTFLRFQSVSLEAICEVLPDLLAPFRLAEAIDWKDALDKVPSEDRGEMVTALAKLESRHANGRWKIAERMAEIFSGYRNARVVRISAGRSRAIRIELFTNKEFAKRLIDVPASNLWDGRQALTITTGEYASIQIGGTRMGDNFQAGQAGAMGPQAHAHDMTFQQIWNQSGKQFDLKELAVQLATLRDSMSEQASRPEHHVAIGNVAAAKSSAESGDGPKALEFLKAAGKWALDVSTKISVGVATAAIKSSLGV